MACAALLFLLAISIVSAYPQQAVSGRKYALDAKIVGGNETTIEKYPFTVSLWTTDHLNYPELQICGASIASTYWVITAGHCLYRENASALFIRAGSTYKHNGTRYDVSQIIFHPKFYERGDGFTDFDIGLLKLKTPVVFSSKVKTVSLPSASLVVDAGVVVTVVGWGTISGNGNDSEVLREVSVPVVSYDECLADLGVGINNDTMICAGLKEGGKDSCEGDSGGPLLLGSTIVGIVSEGSGCGGANSPGVYTNVAFFRDWFRTVTGL